MANKPVGNKNFKTMQVPDIQKKAIIQKGIDLLGVRFDSKAARILMAAIALQESNFEFRKQIPSGIARGLWQFERGGGVKGVLLHQSSKQYALKACEKEMVKPTADDVYLAITENDALAAAFARLLLWTDPRPIPLDEKQAWDYYIRNWRPGKARPEHWAKNWRLANELYR